MLDQIMNWLAEYGVLIVFLTILVESSGLPVPGESMLIAAGVLAGQNKLPLWEVFLAAWAGGALGDNIGYLLGRRFGRRFVYRWAARLRVPPATVADFEARFLKRGPPIVLFARFIFILRQLAGFLAGTARMPYGRFSLYNVLGAALWPAVYCGGAYVLGATAETYLAAGHWLFAGIAAIGLLALGVTIWKFVAQARAAASVGSAGSEPPPLPVDERA